MKIVPLDSRRDPHPQRAERLKAIALASAQATKLIDFCEKRLERFPGALAIFERPSNDNFGDYTVAYGRIGVRPPKTASLYPFYSSNPVQRANHA
jgi:hypothetical protein